MISKKYIVIVVGVILTVIVPLIVLNISYFKGFSTLDMFGYSLGFVLIVGSIFLFFLANIEDLIAEHSENLSKSNVVQNVEFKRFANEMNHLSSAIKSKDNLVYPVNKEHMYDRMIDFLTNSRNRADLMYMGNKPPQDYQGSHSKDRYIAGLEEFILLGKIPVRRVIIYSQENKIWIQGLIDKCKDIKTFSLFILSEEIASPISLQIFDNSKAVLVNLDNSDSSLKSRDIIIDSQELNPIFESYYDRILKKSIPIVENGKINTNNYRKYF
jgi:hypothetical protein